MYKIYNCDVIEGLKQISSNSIDCIVTSPPYWNQRDYEVDGQIGLENTMEEYVKKIIEVFDEVFRVLKPTGTLFLNLGDTYSNGYSKLVGTSGRKGYGKNKAYETKKINTDIKKKSKMLIPQRIAIAMIDRGWILRNDIIWDKLNPMPESVADRFTNNYENIFFFTKRSKYYFKKLYEPFSEKTINSFGKGRNKRSIWEISTSSSSTRTSKHFATFPSALVRTCLEAGCPENGLVLDPFLGSGTVMLEAKKIGLHCIGIELKQEYAEMAITLVDDLFTKVDIVKKEKNRWVE